MLLIRDEQYKQFSDYTLKSFKERMVAHLADVFPLQTGFVDQTAVAAFADAGVDQARTAGFDTEATVQSYLDHMVLLGFDFCRNPLYTEITAPLFDTDIEYLIERHDQMHELAWAYLDRTRGPDAANLFRASARLRGWTADPKRKAATDAPSMLLKLKTIFPEKTSAHPDDLLAQFCSQAGQRAQADGFTSAEAQTAYVAAAFLAGLGFYHDPLVTGAVPDQVQALADETDATERTRLLIAGVGIYLERVIESARAANIQGME
jgi:hypothetical protein